MNALAALRRAVGSLLPVRKLEAAETDRLNSAHWSNANGLTLNEDLLADRETIVNRCCYEEHNNALVEGVMNTHSTDVVGPDGPILSLECGKEATDADRRWCEAAERGWADWWELPDACGKLSGVEFLDLATRGVWTRGEHFWQLTTAPAADFDPQAVALRLLAIDTRRLRDPFAAADSGSAEIVMGVEHNGCGRPIAYHIDRPIGVGPGLSLGLGLDSERLPAEMAVHDFKSLEPGQLRGYPLLGPCLQDVADLRDFDVQTMDAARAAADYAVMLVTDHPEAVLKNPTGSMRVRRREITVAPTGFRPEVLDPKHPTANYVEFRRERLRSLGRPAGMPLLTILADASRHNYSSARLDLQNYHRANRSFQARLARRSLRPVLAAVLRELSLIRGPNRLPGPRPKRVKAVWTWPAPPHVDPAKEAKAARERLGAGLTTLADELAREGVDLETHVGKLARVRQAFDDAGLDPDEWVPAPHSKATAASAAGRSGDTAEAAARTLAGVIERLDEIEERVESDRSRQPTTEVAL